jgi:methionyl aminopeptidase
VTVTVGEPSPEDVALMDVTERSMWAGLARAVAGGRLTDISAAVEQTVTAEDHEYGIVDHYGGHGIGTEMHQDPHVLNYGRPGRGPKLVPGLALAIEPMVTVGNPATLELEDGWTVVTKDGSRAAHFEHTVAITPEGPWVLTAEDGGVAGLAPFGVTPRT